MTSFIGTYLQCRENGHNKHYFVAVVKQTKSGGWAVRTAWGGIGKEVQQKEALYQDPILARKAYSDVVNEKCKKGYEIEFQSAFDDPPNRWNVWRALHITTKTPVPSWFDDDNKFDDEVENASKAEPQRTSTRIGRKDAEWNF